MVLIPDTYPVFLAPVVSGQEWGGTLAGTFCQALRAVRRPAVSGTRNSALPFSSFLSTAAYLKHHSDNTHTLTGILYKAVQ